MPEGRYWLQTLGCPKNEVDSEKLAGLLERDGLARARDPRDADLVVVNTCAFVEAARQESVEAVLDLADARRPGARLVVTGCMAERYGDELAAALPEVDLVAGFGQDLRAGGDALAIEASRAHGEVVPGSHRAHGEVGPGSHRAHGEVGPGPEAPRRAPVALRGARRAGAPSFDLLALPRPPSATPWAYVKVAEGCDRRCGFCAIPSFRGAQRSRPAADVLAEVASLAGDPAVPVQEIVLVAQDLASYGRDRSAGAAGGGSRRSTSRPTPLVSLVGRVRELVARTRLLYLYPSGLTGELVDAVLATGVPYFDLSLQHVSRPHLARMRRWGDGERFLERIAAIRGAAPDATFRSSFILGYPGETEEDQCALVEFLTEAQLDWAGFFPFSKEQGTHAAELGDQVPAGLALERLRECADVQDGITARRRDALVGRELEVLVDAPGTARSVHEAPEIDGIVRVPRSLEVGTLVGVRVRASLGTDLVGDPVGDRSLLVAGGSRR